MKVVARKREIKGGFLVESNGRRFRLHPTLRCGCGAPLMLGNPFQGLWHCSNLENEKGAEFMRHFELSRRII